MSKITQGFERFLEDSGSRWFVVLTAYLDESGTHHHSPVAWIAGYLFSKAKAIRFKKEWCANIRPLLPPGVNFFHAADCWARCGKWKGYSEQQRDVMFIKMVSLVKESALFGVCVGVEVADYEAYVRREPGFKRFIGTPYAMCALKCAELIGDGVREHNLDGDVMYTFESGGGDQGDVAGYFQTIGNNEELQSQCRYYDLGFQRKSDAIPLQSADLLAWECSRADSMSRRDKDRDRKLRTSLRELFHVPHYVYFIAGKENLGGITIVNAIRGMRSRRFRNVKS